MNSDHIIKRTPADVAQERRINQLWAYLRNNCGSLESERVCRLIRELVESSDTERIAELKAAHDTIERLRRELTTAKKTNNRLRKEQPEDVSPHPLEGSR